MIKTIFVGAPIGGLFIGMDDQSFKNLCDFIQSFLVFGFVYFFMVFGYQFSVFGYQRIVFSFKSCQLIGAISPRKTFQSQGEVTSRLQRPSFNGTLL